MEKRIFNEADSQDPQIPQAKREFTQADVVLDIEIAEQDGVLFEQISRPSRRWVRVLLAMLGLFIVAVIAQSVQWLWDSWQAHQWIYFAFALVFFGVSLTGVAVLYQEWRKLRWLRKHHQDQVFSQTLWQNQGDVSGEVAVKFCQHTITQLSNTPLIEQSVQRWQKELQPAYNSQEVLFLFSENVLSPIDERVKKWISQSASENAVIVALSPLAVVDVLVMAWRNIALVNQITRAYGMELGYFSRLKLFRMVLTNMVFAGATEMVSDVGLDFFSQNLTAKLSARVAQGIGVGLLTVRLGIKAMEFCRPVAFRAEERPKLSLFKQALLGQVKEIVLHKTRETEQNRV